MLGFLRKVFFHRAKEPEKRIVDGSMIGLIPGQQYEYRSAAFDATGNFGGYASLLVGWHPLDMKNGDIYRVAGVPSPVFTPNADDYVILTRYVLDGAAYQPDKMRRD